MAFHRVLVALDRSAQRDLVFEQALKQLVPQDAHLMIVHAIRPESEVQTAPFLGIGTIADVDTYSSLKHLHHARIQKAVKTAQNWLQPYYQQAIAQSIETTLDCRVAEPSLWICELAADWGAELVVLGRRGYQGLKEVVLGSVSNYVLHHAPCSVLVVQGMPVSSDSSKSDLEQPTVEACPLSST